MLSSRSISQVSDAAIEHCSVISISFDRDFSVVVLAARNKDELEKTAIDIRSDGAEAAVYALDLSEPRSAQTVIKGTLGHSVRIDALLKIAGAVPQIDLFEMTEEQWRAGAELKLHGARRMTILAWEALKMSKGSVVFMSGSAALDPKPAFAAVAAINAAITALAKAFAEQGINEFATGRPLGSGASEARTERPAMKAASQKRMRRRWSVCALYM